MIIGTLSTISLALGKVGVSHYMDLMVFAFIEVVLEIALIAALNGA